MAKKFLTSLNLSQNQLQNAVIHSLETAPSTGSSVEGQIYYDTSLSVLRYFDGAAWVTLAQGGDLASAISAAIDELTTDDIEEGSNNLYFTNQRAIDAVGGSATSENTANTVVKRDSSGNFAATDITVNEISFGEIGRIYEDSEDLYIVSGADGDDIIIEADDIRLNAVDDIFLTAGSTSDVYVRGPGNIYLVGPAIFAADNEEGLNADRVATQGYADTAATDAYNNAVSYADALDTDDIAEGSTNLYFTDARSRTSISSGDNTITYNSSTGEITANTSTMATVSYVDGEITDLTTYVDQEISDSANTLTTAYQAADNTLSNTLTTAYQNADNAVISSLTSDFQDADNTVLSTLRGEIAAATQGLDIKDSVRVATTANISNLGSVAYATQIDGVEIAADDRVLVKNQSTASQNGIYVVTDKTGSWELVRAADAGNGGLTPGSFTFVEEGTVNGDAGFVISTDGDITVGTTGITWTQFSGTGQIVAGDGLTKSGATLAVGGTADRISVTADAVDIANTYVGQSSITTLGTVTTGTWNGSTVDVAHGGTGATTLTGYIVGNGTDPLSTVSTIPGSDINGDISGNAANVTGIVAIENGGTGANTVAGARSALSATTKYAVNNTTLNPTSNTITWTVTHNLNTSDVTVQMRDLGDSALVEADVVITNANTVTISWYSSGTVSADAYRAVVVG